MYHFWLAHKIFHLNTYQLHWLTNELVRQTRWNDSMEIMITIKSHHLTMAYHIHRSKWFLYFQKIFTKKRRNVTSTEKCTHSSTYWNLPLCERFFADFPTIIVIASENRSHIFRCDWNAFFRYHTKWIAHFSSKKWNENSTLVMMYKKYIALNSASPTNVYHHK